MPRKTETTEVVRTVGLVSSFVAVAAIGLTLVTDMAAQFLADGCRGLNGFPC